MEFEPVAITGIGVISPIGLNQNEFYQSLERGTVGIGEIKRQKDERPISGKAFQVKNFMPPKYASILDPHLQYILAATEEALKDAGCDPSQMDRERIGIAVSSSKGGMRTFERFFDRFNRRRSAILGARVYANLIPNICAQWIARHWKLSGPAKPAVAACATGLYAVLEGVRMIEHDEADYCIAGSGDSSITELMLAGYKNMGVLSQGEIRPFDRKRDGFLVGEGAGIVILEKLKQAISRGAKIYATVLSYQYGFESSHVLAFSKEGEGLSRCLSELIQKANIKPSEISYLNLHGTATEQGDVYETSQIKKAFGKDAYKIPMSATKSMVGHMLGASGVVEIITCLLAMKHGFIPPTANLNHPDPECDLDYTPILSKKKKINTAGSISLGFGGQLGAILLKKD